MAFDKTWTESNPTNEEVASLGDDRMREDRYGVRERAAVQHKTYADESGHDDVWEHTPGECTVLFVGTKVSFPTPNTTTKGCMAIATDENNKIYHWSGTEWTETGVVLTGGQAQTIAGVKTFSEIPVFSKGLSANNAYLKARNAAGNGNVDLIKADASNVPTVKEGAVLATSAAPTTDPMIPTKKYVDDQIAAYIASKVTLSAYTIQDSESNSMLKAHAYLAATGGRVYARVTNQNSKYLRGYVGTTNDPAGAGTLIQESADAEGSLRTCISFDVAEGEYFEVTYDGTNTPTILWKSMGTLSKPVDQD